MSAEKEKVKMPTADNAVALLVDHQAGLMLFPGDIEPLRLRNNSIGLSKVLKSHNIPVLLTPADLNRFKKMLV